MDAPDLVRTAIREQAPFKFVVAELQRRPASKDAAELVVEAYRRGEAPPWLAALLLGECRDKVGYATAREILVSAPRALAESYAGVALAQIGGLDAMEDLKTLMFNSPDQHSREGAASGLEVLGLPEAAPSILEAVMAGKIRRHTGGRILARVFADQNMVLKLLKSGDERQVRLATEIIDECLLTIMNGTASDTAKSFASRPSADLLEALARVLSNQDITMNPRKRQRLHDWRKKRGIGRQRGQ
jgi:hypothetical protein